MGLQLCASEGSDSFDYDWNPIMQTILVLSCLLAATSSLYLYHPAPLLVHPSSGYGLNQAHPGGGSSFQHVSRLHKREAEPKPTPSSSTTASRWPTTPSTQTGRECELSVSPPRATDAVARGAPSLTGFLSLPPIITPSPFLLFTTLCQPQLERWRSQ